MRSFLAALLVLPASLVASGATVSGRVSFGSNPAPSVVVQLESGGTRVVTRTDSSGAFSATVPEAKTFTVIVPAFCLLNRCAPRVERHVTTSDLPLQIELATPVVHDEVVVTAARTATRLDESAKSVVVIGAKDIRDSAARSADDLLRQVPGFGLFRRSSSSAANPTSQGASLRGIGGSGASRTLVMLDGVPLNDPFGGWVAWSRAPREALGRLEVLRGGGSDLYGSSAFGGVVNMLTSPAVTGVQAEASSGTLGTADGWLSLAHASDAGSARIWGDLANFDGYFAVPATERGAADRRVSSAHRLVELSGSRRVTSAATLFARASWFSEERGNGTELQTNDTHSRNASARGSFVVKGADLETRVYGSDQTYHQSFSSVSGDRNSEQPTRLQTVPSSSLGVSLQASRAFSRQMLLSGVETLQVEGWSEEATPSGIASRAGGRQRTTGVFVEDLMQVAPTVSLTAAMRFDTWDNFDASARAQNGEVSFRDRRDSAFSPRLALSWRASDLVTLSASCYRAFRAPTLNELYRSFRLGNVVTLANPQLAAERLTGSELGAYFRLAPAISARLNLYQMDVSDAIVNVSRSTTPSLTTRQRDNVGRTSSRGVEIDFEGAVARDTSVSAGYLYVRPVVTSFRGDPSLEGLDLPQVPRQQITVQLRRAGAWITTTLQGRWTAAQFDDDRNELRLAGYTVVDAYASRRIANRLEAFTSVENVFDERAEVGRTPNLTIGPPRSVTIGLRVR